MSFLSYAILYGIIATVFALAAIVKERENVRSNNFMRALSLTKKPPLKPFIAPCILVGVLWPALVIARAVGYTKKLFF